MRFQAMVQDTSQSPEIYVSVTEDNYGGYGLYEKEAQNAEDSFGEHIDYSKLKEREVVWAVTVPGQTPWMREVRNQSRLQIPD